MKFKFSLQTTLLIVFGFFILFGLAVFAGYIKLGSSSKETEITGTAVLWGTIDATTMRQYILNSTLKTQTYKITYIQKNSSTYDQDLVEAFARGEGPDIFLVSPDIFWKERDKMYPIPYASLPIATYTSTYMDLANIYLGKDGVLALPLFIDPIVGYWNKDMFANVGIAAPPKTWKEFLDLSPKLSVVGDDFIIKKSTVALGEYGNIRHAKDILSLLFLQAGDPIMHSQNDGKYILDLGSINSKENTYPAATALGFYTQFSDPAKRSIYTWNKTFISDRDQFLAGDLAYYIGLGSELSTLRKKNPNLNFDMTFAPQGSLDANKMTIGSLFGVAVSKQSKQLPLAFLAAGDMASGARIVPLIQQLSKGGLTLSPARRDLVPNDPADKYASLLYQSALVSRTWADPNGAFSNQVFFDMVSDVQSGKSTTQASVFSARTKLAAFLKTIQR